MRCAYLVHLLVVLLHQPPVQPSDGQPPDQLHLHIRRDVRKQVVSGSRVYVVCGGHRPWTWGNLRRRGLQLVAVDAINDKQVACMPPHLGWDERPRTVKEFAEDSGYDSENSDYDSEDYEEDSDYDDEDYEEDSARVSPHQKSLQSAEREAGGCQGTGSSRASLFLAVCNIILGLGAAVATPLILCHYLRGLATHLRQHLRESAMEAARSLIRPPVSSPASDQPRDGSERHQPEAGGSGGQGGVVPGAVDMRLCKPSNFDEMSDPGLG